MQDALFNPDNDVDQFLCTENKGENVNWTALGKKYNIKNTAGIFPSNAGQILKQFAFENGIQTEKFNQQKIVSGRDIIQRVRRKYLRVRGLAVPHQRPANKIRKALQKKIDDGVYDIGVCIAPKVFDFNKISNTGELVVDQKEVYGRKFPLLKIREQSLQEQETLGVLRSSSDEEYSSLPPADVIKKLNEYGKDETGSHIENLALLKSTERTRHWKCWHDHSDILNHTYVNFMVSCIYDPAVFLSNEEYRKKFPYKKQDVQSLVEKPHLYILGQSGSSDKDQLTYVKTRTDDLKGMGAPVICKTTNAPYQDVFPVFSGDNPARQFESGHQRGGHYSCLCGVHVDSHQNLECCFRQPAKSLQARLDLFKNGIQWKNFNITTNPNPFAHLKVQQIIDELDERRLDILDTRKESVSKQLAEHLEGIQRPPALFCTSMESQNPGKDLNLQKYEVLMCEPLHDISNMVTNLIAELPYHLSNKSMQKEYEIFSNTTIGDRNQIRGSDARLYAIKLTKFTQTKHSEGKVSEQVVDLCNSLTDIISIAYSKEGARNPQQILRLYNQTFIFGHLCKAVIGNPIKMSSRKFYGSHFHSLVTHAPEIYRLFCLRSILAENEERSFGTLRSISLNTSDRKPEHVIKNAIIRYNAQQNTPVKPDSFQHQDSIISKQSKFLPTRGPTIFKKSFISARMSLFQSHLERIADYLELGENVWWSQDDTSIIFHDCPTSEVHSLPQILHFRKSMASDVQHYLEEKWEICVQQFTEGELQLPIKRIKRLQNGKLEKIYNTGGNERKESQESAAHSNTNEHERLTNAELHNDENAKMSDQHPEIAVTAEVHFEKNTSTNMDSHTEEYFQISDLHPEIPVLDEADLGNVLATVRLQNRPQHIEDANVPLSSGDEHHLHLKKFIKTDVHYGNAHSLEAAHPDEHARIPYPNPTEDADADFHTCENVKMSDQHPKIAVTADVHFGNEIISCPHPLENADKHNARVPDPQQEIAFSGIQPVFQQKKRKELKTTITHKIES
ncbi:uncharacterized protein LOC134263700, partial [Saccostrea cucullata]|uniref:uncharacterized protein LOC134263700 n=1 Tax=Saccostrea cuccullata TaxID=36930 RepID=UPI002ED23B81